MRSLFHMNALTALATAGPFCPTLCSGEGFAHGLFGALLRLYKFIELPLLSSPEVADRSLSTIDRFAPRAFPLSPTNGFGEEVDSRTPESCDIYSPETRHHLVPVDRRKLEVFKLLYAGSTVSAIRQGRA
jgi:hypothetical protein